MTIVGQATVPPALDIKFKCAVRECDRKPLTPKEQARLAKSGAPCATLGSIKHECVEDKMEKEPGWRTERTYNMKKRPPQVLRSGKTGQARGFYHARAIINKAGFGWAKGQWKRPDAIVGNRAPYHIFDAKFPCSQKVKSGGGVGPGPHLSARGVSGASMMSTEQRNAYTKIANGSSKKNQGTVTATSPSDAKGVKC